MHFLISILIVIFIVVLLLTPIIVIWFLEQKEVKHRLSFDLPLGKKFSHKTKDGFEAIIVAENSIPSYKDGFVFNGDKVDGKKLAKSCAFAMKALNKTILTIGPSLMRGKKVKNIKFCVFYFVDQKTFLFEINKVLEISGNKKNFIAFSSFIIDYKSSQEIPMITIRAEHMKSVLEKGSLSIHELIHIASYLSTGNWDYKDHVLWNNFEYFCDNGINIEWMAKGYWKKLNK